MKLVLGDFVTNGLTDLFSVVVDGQRVGAGVLPPHSCRHPEEKIKCKKNKPQSCTSSFSHMEWRRAATPFPHPVAEGRGVKSAAMLRVEAQPHIAKSVFIRQMVYLSHTRWFISHIHLPPVIQLILTSFYVHYVHSVCASYPFHLVEHHFPSHRQLCL